MEEGELYEGAFRMAASRAAAVLLSFVLVAGIGRAAPGETQPGPYIRACQSALVVTDGSSETLILQLSYQGKLADLAWLIPVPARPEVNETNPQILRDLEQISEPVLVRPPGHPRHTRPGKAGHSSASSGPCTPQANVTVFPAQDIARARRWLCPKDSLPSDPTETALNLYADLGWWYVGVGVSLESWRAAIAEDLRAVDGGETGLAPEAVARAILADADSGRAEGGQRAAALGRLVDSLRGAVEESADRESPVSCEEELTRTYANVMHAGRLRHAGRPDNRTVLTCLDGIAADVGLDNLLAAASTTGLSSATDIESLADDLSNSLGRDLRDGVPYPDSRWRKWHECLARLGVMSEDGSAAGRRVYRDLEIILDECASFPPTRRADLMRGRQNRAWRERRRNAEDPLLKCASSQLLGVVGSRSRLYRSLLDYYAEATQAADGHLAQGVLPALRLDFPSAQPVCAPALTGARPGPEDTIVYVLSDRKVEASGYQVAYAERLVGEEPAIFPQIAGLVRGRTDFLTVLRADGSFRALPAEAFKPTVFAGARREYATPDGQLLTKDQALLYALVGVVPAVNGGAAKAGMVVATALVGLVIGRFVLLRLRRPDAELTEPEEDD